MIESYLHPVVFKTIYKNAEMGETVMKCHPKRWDQGICWYGSVLQLELCALPHAVLQNVHLATVPQHSLAR